MTVFKMKLLTVQYLGFTAMDRRFSAPMLPWIVSEIRKRDSYEQICMGVEDGCVQAYNTDFELQWSHRVYQIIRFSQVEPDPSCFLYLYRDDQEQLLYCYLFQANSPTEVADLYQQMRDSPPSRSVSSAAQLTSLCVDISPSSSHFYEVLYVGKLRVSHRRLPDAFVDQALDRLQNHEHIRAVSHNPGGIQMQEDRRGSIDSIGSLSLEVPVATEINSSTPENEEGGKSPLEPSKCEHNRTMVLQVGRTELRLISPDRKLILLHKQHRDVASCVQGLRNPQHFGFLCREQSSHGSLQQSNAQQYQSAYIGYIFKCESNSVAADAVNAISQAFNSSDKLGQTKSSAHIASCEHCPMVWYHRLCAEIENLSDRKTQAAIFRRIDQLDEEEQSTIVTKFKGAETDSIREQNEFLMMLLRAHCEMKQMRHIHDTAENRSEFLNQYLGGSTIFMKAKRSLSNSFDHLLKRKGSNEVGINVRSELSLPVSQQHFGTKELLTPDSLDPDKGRTRGMSPEQIKSPMMDIFMKVGSSPRTSQCEEGSPPGKTPLGGSWRQAIFNRVVTPAKKLNEARTRDRAELRGLWKRAIKQAVLLVRMEKENARLRARQEETAVKRIKLEYDELLGTSVEAGELQEVWESLLSGRDLSRQASEQMLQQAIRRGVPRARRGEVWHFLADQQAKRTPPPQAAVRNPNYNTPYPELLRQLTSHQHAILIDLGRTFPQHPYFSSPLGPGQLALFNLLKAYSLLDSELGYCQGLSFVAGVLLLHMEESEAYRMLRHLMFRGLRTQYLPDMVALQVQLYQLSRLLHDRLPELYSHLDAHEVAPTLYAAPWLLTLFASQFPLGFVARVFDLLFLEGPDVLFKVALALLTQHAQQLLTCGSFEEIMDYLKNSLAAIDAHTLEGVMRHVFHMQDVARQLHEYKVEYQVLQEEMASVKPQIDALHKLEVENITLQEQNKQLLSQLEVSLQNVQRLERTRTLQQAALNRLEVQSRGLEVSVATLGAFIDSLVEQKVDVEIPGDVRRIVSQLMVAERRKTAANIQNANLIKTISNSTHMFKKGDKQMVKSLSTGRIGLTGAENSLPRSNSLSEQLELQESGLPSLRVLSEEPALKPTSLSTKMSHFFSTSHNHILQNKLGSGVAGNEHSATVKQVIREDSRESLLSPAAEPRAPLVFMSECGMTVTSSPTSSVDSGVETPLSPKHPLSNCDVNFTFNGTTKLKNIRNMSRNSSPDLLSK